MRNFGFLIRDLSRLYARNFERHSVDLGLTLDQCKALCYLQRNEGISQVRLAYLTDIDPMTLGRLLTMAVELPQLTQFRAGDDYGPGQTATCSCRLSRTPSMPASSPLPRRA